MPSRELQFPFLGVVRRGSLRSTPDARSAFPAVWASNVVIDENLDRRLRGGSRPGLTKYADETDFGATINDLASINVTTAASGASEMLFVLVNQTIRTIEGGVTTAALMANLTDAFDDDITDGASVITVGDASAPAEGFLVTGQQHVFAVTSAGVTKMDPKTGQADNIVPSAGTVPTGCTFGAVYRDRLCLSGEDNAIYMSRQGDYTDWDYGAHFEDQQRAVPFQLALGADVGALPTALIPCMDKYMVCATARSLWVVQGDPTADGSLQRVSEHVGIIGPRAWVKFDNQIVFLSEDGLYMVAVDGSNLTPLSPESLPEELRDIDLTAKKVSIGWNQDRRAVHIYVRTNTAALTDIHWIYELDAKAFWPMEVQTDHSPEVVVQHGGELLLACNDDIIRKIGGTDDDGTAIESHVAIGPLRLGPPNHFGRIKMMHGSLAGDGGTVTWRVVTGNTADEANDNAKAAIILAQAGGDYSALVQSSGTWTAGRAVMAYPRTRAVWCCLWLEGAADWAFEGIAMETEPSAKWRGA